jgi:hypothetical protein
MDQNLMERLLAQMEAHIKAGQQEMKDDMMAKMETRMDANQQETKTAINSLRSALEGAIKTWVEMKACQEVTRLFGGKEGANSRRARGRGAPESPQGSDGPGDNRNH